MTRTPELTDLPDLTAALAASLPEQRWFGDKHRVVRELALSEGYWIRHDSPGLLVALAEIDFTGGERARYQLVLGLRPWDDHLAEELEPGYLKLHSRGEETAGDWVVFDAVLDASLMRELFETLAAHDSIEGINGGRLSLRTLHPPLPSMWPTPSGPQSRQDHTNSTLMFGEEVFVKLLRRLWPGVSPEVELLEGLDAAGFRGIAQPLAVVDAEAAGESSSTAIAQRYLRNGTDGFTLALTSLRDLYGDLLLDADGAMPLPEDTMRAVQDQGGSFIGTAESVAVLSAEMHLALASLQQEEMAARPLSREDLLAVAQELEELFERLLQSSNPLLEPLRVHRAAIGTLAHQVREVAPSGLAIRVHGDYHLGQVLRTDSGWFALDFEGRPAVPVETRRRKTTALQDVAGMLRSFDYAARVALHQQVSGDRPSSATLEPYGQAWATVLRGHFLEAYLERCSGHGLVPEDPRSVDVILTGLEASQALYEVEYELHTRPDWLPVPLEGIARLLQRIHRPVG